ncbi:hypothetical protein [Phaeodactylibacter sp.]|uniref:hypothetical protein n=1 Tax=Phaeodactylibacter sp. TaxID=1940289 RepID=UPI0025FFC669|nr:hypothetical protein [Phaeodactylibacter sp.]MCI4648063.1 hypothetical protein [Phaeodactylibacter sp.]MCI5092352.1 hypothetical protein [Phaeodactylibacter sp.]
MKKSLILFSAFMLGIFLVSCSEGAPDNNSKTETTASTESTNDKPNPDKAQIAIPEDQSTEDFVFDKLKKGFDRRGIKLSADQETALKQLIRENDLTAENLKAKRAEIFQKVQTEILTDEQKASIKKR